jgi:plasmid stability protein
MNTASKRATIYLDPAIHKALRIKAAETSRSMSDIVNEAIRHALAEDAEDLAAFDLRANEPLVTYENMLNELKKDGRI